jgi:hypothetical protein
MKKYRNMYINFKLRLSRVKINNTYIVTSSFPFSPQVCGWAGHLENRPNRHLRHRQVLVQTGISTALQPTWNISTANILGTTAWYFCSTFAYSSSSTEITYSFHLVIFFQSTGRVMLKIYKDILPIYRDILPIHGDIRAVYTYILPTFRLRLDRSTDLYIYKAKYCKLLVLFTHAQKNKIYR